MWGGFFTRSRSASVCFFAHRLRRGFYRRSPRKRKTLFSVAHVAGAGARWRKGMAPEHGARAWRKGMAQGSGARPMTAPVLGEKVFSFSKVQNFAQKCRTFIQKKLLNSVFVWTVASICKLDILLHWSIISVNSAREEVTMEKKIGIPAEFRKIFFFWGGGGGGKYGIPSF